MSDPLELLELALKPNSVPSNNYPLLNFYFCAHLSISLDKFRQALTRVDTFGKVWTCFDKFGQV